MRLLPLGSWGNHERFTTNRSPDPFTDCPYVLYLTFYTCGYSCLSICVYLRASADAFYAFPSHHSRAFWNI